MNDSNSVWSVLLQRIDMGHDIVSATTFFNSNHLECLVAHDKVRFDGLNGLTGDLGNAKLLFCLSKPKPEFSPCCSSLAGGEDLLHLIAWSMSSGKQVHRN